MNLILIALILLSHSSILAQVTSQTPLGFEAITGMRSEYVYRGFKQAQQMLEFQIEGEITLDEDYYLGYGAWYGTGTGTEDFTETGAKISLNYDLDQWQWYNSLKFRDLNKSTFESGIELTSKLTYFFSESNHYSNELSGIISFDQGADGLYGAIEYAGYKTLNDKLYLSFQLGLSAIEDYYGISGSNDFYSKVSLTYNLTRQVSLSPFLHSSLNISDRDRPDYIGAGFWFEISF